MHKQLVMHSLPRSIEQLLKEVEQSSQKSESNAKKRLLWREKLIGIKILIIKKTGRNQKEIDRKIVQLLSKEVFQNGGSGFEKKLYELLENIEATRSKEEFDHVIKLYKKTIQA